MICKKTNVVLVYGGISPEHEISKRSAYFIAKTLFEDSRYQLHLIGITRDGHWYRQNPDHIDRNPGILEIETTSTNIQAISSNLKTWLASILNRSVKDFQKDRWIFFPITHGGFGEDGSLQGIFECARVPYVGSRVLGSAMAMNKIISKQLVQAHKIPIVAYQKLVKKDYQDYSFSQRRKIIKFPLPVFIKPCSGGSSIGVHRVTDPSCLDKAIRDAFSYDECLVIEPALDIREIECALFVKDGKLKISQLGEAVVYSDFYSYEAKYKNQKHADIQIPASLTLEQEERISGYARSIFDILRLDGFARIDFFLHKTTQSIYFNEINTLPGFTDISQFPLLWKAFGYSIKDLLSNLIENALYSLSQ